MKEIWKDIKDFEGLYQVSNTGLVRSLRNDIILKPMDAHGYNMVFLGRKNARVIHRMVAEAFIPNSEGKPQVNHIDGNKRNNYADNLEWATESENMVHAFKNGLIKNSIIKTRKVAQFDKEGNLIKIFNTAKEAGKEMNVHDTSILHACKGKYETSCGYIWKYIGEAKPISSSYFN